MMLDPARQTVDSCPLSITPRSCPFGDACHTCPVRLQAKLRISQPDDEYEREADSVADAVMRMPDPEMIEDAPVTKSDETALQRECVCGGTPGATGECEACRDKRELGMLQRRGTQPAAASPQPSEVLPIVHEVLQSPGEPLDVETRAIMDRRFGHDFSHVRVHTDAKAAESAQALNALAYTVGSHVVFGGRQYAPMTREGLRLTAHELTHVAQQRTSSPRHELVRARTGDAHEGEAEQLTVRAPDSVKPYTVRSGSTVAGADRAMRQFVTPLGAGGGMGGLTARDKGRRGQSCPPRFWDPFPCNRTGITFYGRRVFEGFNMNIDWDDKEPNCSCECGEYRQFVKGYVKVDGKRVPHKLWNGVDLQEDYQEDGEYDKKTNARYGHRADPETSGDTFIPNRKTGCSYRGRDEPSVLDLPAGAYLDMAFKFKGQAYDDCRKVEGEKREWEVKYEGSVPYASTSDYRTPV